MTVLDKLAETWAAAMWQASWQGSLVVLAAWLICRAFPAMPARGQCWLWRLAILKFMAAFLLPTLVRLPLLRAASLETNASVPAAAAQPTAAAIIPSAASGNGRLELDRRPTTVPPISTILWLLWLAGLACCAGRLAVAWRRTCRLREAGRAASDAECEPLNAQAAQFGLRRPPALLVTAGDGSPLLVGMFRPAIVVPAITLRHLSPAELAMVLGHELAHIRRGDLPWSLAAAVSRAVFFFHPLAWFAQRRLNLAQEIAADAFTIRRQAYDPACYGKLLVSVVGRLGPSRLLPTMSMGVAGSVRSLTWRLSAMSRVSQTSRRAKIAAGVLLAAMVAVGIVPWRLVAAEPKVVEDEQRIACFTISEGKKGRPKTVIFCPRVSFQIGQQARVEGETELGKLEVTIHSLADKKPIEHVVKFKLSDKTRHEVIIAPRLRLPDDQKGSIAISQPDGEEVVFTAEVSSPPASVKNTTNPAKSDPIAVDAPQTAERARSERAAPEKGASEKIPATGGWNIKYIGEENGGGAKVPLPTTRAANDAGGKPRRRGVSSSYRIEPPDVIEIKRDKSAANSLPATVDGQYLVGPDGTVNLRQYGVVHIAGKTIGEARAAIENQLQQYASPATVAIDVVATNSKVYYVITEAGSSGDYVHRLPITGDDTVLDAVAQIGGLPKSSGRKVWIARSTPNNFGHQQILSVDWDAITQGANTESNYQLLPGDRLFIGAAKGQ
jgi:beta-lactamase regulating signal transducer with metallopeptidase domain/protein involved in polysaccharide export with SLBB domain